MAAAVRIGQNCSAYAKRKLVSAIANLAARGMVVGCLLTIQRSLTLTAEAMMSGHTVSGMSRLHPESGLSMITNEDLAKAIFEAISCRLRIRHKVAPGHGAVDYSSGYRVREDKLWASNRRLVTKKFAGSPRVGEVVITPDFEWIHVRIGDRTSYNGHTGFISIDDETVLSMADPNIIKQIVDLLHSKFLSIQAEANKHKEFQKRKRRARQRQRQRQHRVKRR